MFSGSLLRINAFLCFFAPFCALVVVFFGVSLSSASARERIRIVGSSTVFPFATVVAERYSLSRGVEPPVVEATGTGGGIKLFCKGTDNKGTDNNTPDITNASARMKVSQLELCRKNGVSEVLEVAFGYDGIVIAQSQQGKTFPLSLRTLYLALAKQVPGEDGKLADNPHTKWSDIDPALPAVKIEVLGPPPTSGTRTAFVEIAMDKGARTFPSLAALRERDKKAFKKAAYALREDGAYIESGENDNLIVQKLRRNKHALGIFGFSFLDRNRSVVKGIAVDKIEPTFDNIVDGSYPIARSLYFYVKVAHLVANKGLQDYVASFLSDDMMDFLLDEGLIPLSAEELVRVRASVAERRSVSVKDLE